jgi:uncharacterized phage protein (TIGR02220 family)
MAAAVRIDQEAFTDPRFKRLGRLLGTSVFDALGRMAFVWSHCTVKQVHVISASVLHDLSDAENFGEMACAAGLLEPADEGFRVLGLKGRIEWLANLRKNSRKGGAARKARAKPDGSQTEARRKPEGYPDGSQTEAKAKPERSPITITLPLTLALPSQREEVPCEASASPAPSSSSNATKRGERKAFAEQVLAHLNEKASRHFTSSGPHVDLICARRAEGYDLDAFKSVIDDRCRRWLKDEKMREHLVPKTLFARKHFASYHDEAKEWQEWRGAVRATGASLIDRIMAAEERRYSGDTA